MQQGATLGEYRVLSHIGSGGMGEVYLAEDPKLGRKVALKILPEASADDVERRRRFLHEARSASALSHPNIVTVFGFGEDSGRDFIAMEYVEGESLRDLLRRGPIPFRRVIEIGIQVASALEAAHAAGVVHRDIKPENILISSTGTAKVLDYGLARLEEPPLTATPDETTMASPLTIPGTLVGTLSYMSPEQAEGLRTDSRTDIFSLGIVLFEMFTGRRPFHARSRVDQIHQIIHGEPPDVLALNPSLPAGVADILSKALAKRPEDRYQHAGDLRLDLRRLGAAPASVATGRRRAWLVPSIVGALVIAAAALLWSQRRPQPAVDATPVPRLSPFTSDPGYEDEPTFSPDGQTIAYVSDRSGNLEIYLRQTGGGTDINLTNDPADDAQPAFSPDGKQIAFVSTRDGATGLVYPNAGTPLLGGDIWVMPAFGGTARRIARGGNFPSWSPDGSKILFTGGVWSNQKLLTVPATGGTPREIPMHLEGRHLFIVRASWSGDGRWIVFEAHNNEIRLVPAQGGHANLIARGRSPAWGSDSQSIVFSTAEAGRNYSLVSVPFASDRGEAGPLRPLTIGRGRDVSPVMSRDGMTIAFAAQTVTFNIEKIAFDAERGMTRGAPVPLTSGPHTFDYLDVSGDGASVTYQSYQGTVSPIWRVDVAGGTPLQLTPANEEDRRPAWSPDKRRILFERLDPDGRALYTMNADGTDPRMIWQGERSLASWSPDGKGIVFFDDRSQQYVVRDLATGVMRDLTADQQVRTPVSFSHDGRWVIYPVTGGDGTSDLHVVPYGEPSKQFVAVATHHVDGHPSLDGAGQWLYFQHDHRNLFRIPGPAQGWRKAEPQQVTDFPESNLFIDYPQITSDGKAFVYSRGRIDSDIWLMDLSRMNR